MDAKKRAGELSYFPLEMFDDGVYEEVGGMVSNVMLPMRVNKVRGVGCNCHSKVSYSTRTL